jgi:CRP/FNR family nitrogen fixation transcriptional regulator
MFAVVAEPRLSNKLSKAKPSLLRECRSVHPAAQGRYGKLAAAFDAIGSTINFSRNGEIYGEGEAMRSFYRVVSGAVRTYKLLGDGRRQISGFHLPGDIFGLGTGAKYQFSAEAVTAATVIAVDRSTLANLAARDSELANELWALTAEELDHLRGLMTTLGRKNAHERLAAFLLEMAGRVGANGALDLPMSRQDIADYLGLTIETVSRTFTQFETEAVIELPSCRRVVLKNGGALVRLNG